MASTPVEFAAPSGLTLTAEFYSEGGDAIEFTDAATERVNNLGVYEVVVTAALDGRKNCRIEDAASNTIAQYQVDIADDTQLRRMSEPAITSSLTLGLLPTPIFVTSDASTVTTGSEFSNDHTATHQNDGTDWELRSVGNVLDVIVDFNIGTGFASRFVKIELEYPVGNSGTVDVQMFNYDTTMWDSLQVVSPSAATSQAVEVLVDRTLYTSALLSRIRFLGAGMTDAQNFNVQFMTLLTVDEDVIAFPTATQIADAVWTEDLSPAQPADSAGDYQKRAALCSGIGGVQCTLTIKDNGGNPIQDAEVWVTSDVLGQNVVAGTKETNVQGEVVFNLDEGLHYRWVQSNSFNFSNPQPFTVVAP